MGRCIITAVYQLAPESTDHQVSDFADLRIRRALQKGMSISHQSKEEEILDLEEAATLLKLHMSDFIKLVEQLPSFEIAGKIRFRRSKLMEWIEQKERVHEWEKTLSQTEDRKIIKFSGGK